MRAVFCQSLVDQASNPDFIFLTGDLGYKALEPLQEALGRRFINAGIAEQNMVSVAAGLARGGSRPWVYSIAPFVYARAFEQIRNDLCLHKLPVVVVGNGGGYGYGVMGATHHAIEDYGTLLGLQGLRAYIPAFDGDVAAIVKRLFEADHPSYLRLGLSEEPKGLDLPAYAPWRKLIAGGGPVFLVVGPLVGGIVEAVRSMEFEQRPNIWLVSELPFDPVPEAFLEDVSRSQDLLVIEEHVSSGGVGQHLAHYLLSEGRAPKRFATRSAQGYVSGRYGSQKFHRQECGLDPASIVGHLATKA